ncbi:MAG TPA: amidohydrolase family protein [Streptosporangiaceae bacterium]|jgi:predicted TIM-barrel fold metal-dependent hydrolase
MTAETLADQNQEVAVSIVDCDVHVEFQNRDAMLQYMPEPWRSRLGSRRGTSQRESYGPLWNARRLDSYGPSGLPAGSEPDLVHKQLLSEAAVDFAIVLRHARGTVDPDLNAALCRASNMWLASTWLDQWSAGGRFFGSISIPVDNVPAAVEEIEHWAGHPGFKQVVLGHYSERPLGYPQYDPIWAAAARHRLPVAMHFTTNAADSIGQTPVGRYPHHVDYHSIAFPVTYAAHLMSWICAGTFDRLPDFRVVMVEGGFLWHRPVLARLAQQWPKLAGEIPAARSDPMSYVRDHVRFTTQPVEESETPGQVARYLELADAANILMFSSDYPHYDYDDPQRALPPDLDRDMHDRIMSRNAIEFYDLPATRPVSELDRA